MKYYVYLLIKYIKSVLWRVAKRLSYIQAARCLKVNRLDVNRQIQSKPNTFTAGDLSPTKFTIFLTVQ